MKSGDESRTHPSLLLRLRYLADQEAWKEFVTRYGPRIDAWCRGWRLKEADVEDVTQEVLLRLARELAKFDYDPKHSFRGWLYTVTHHVFRDWARKRRDVPVGGDEALAALLGSAEAPRSLAEHLDVEFDKEVLAFATDRVRREVGERDWRVFELLAMRGEKAQDVEKVDGRKASALYVCRSRVQKRLREAIARLESKPPKCGATP
jgi:RNA polymerase sigma-70 factor (ECF subfamily)